MKAIASAAANSVVVLSNGSSYLLSGDYNLTSGAGDANISGAAVFLAGVFYLNDIDVDAVDRSVELAALGVEDRILVFGSDWVFTISAITDNTTHWQFNGSAVGTLPADGLVTVNILPRLAIPPTITTASLDAMSVNAVFSQQLTATGDATITYAVTVGSLPDGLSMTSGGLISGTPTTEAAYSFTVTATNDAGSDDQAYSGTVGPEIITNLMPNTALYLPGVSGNYVSTPDAAALDITSDLCLIIRCAKTTWNATNQVLVSKYTAADYSYMLYYHQTFGLITNYSSNGSSVLDAIATALPSVTNGEFIWLAVTVDVDNGASNSVFKYWESTDGVTWSQVGATVLKAVFAFYGGTSVPLEIGSSNVGSSQSFGGDISYAAVYSGIGANTAPGLGTLVAEADFSSPWVGNRYTDSTGKVWTINGSAWAWEIPS